VVVGLPAATAAPLSDLCKLVRIEPRSPSSAPKGSDPIRAATALTRGALHDEFVREMLRPAKISCGDFSLRLINETQLRTVGGQVVTELFRIA
jgi:hypothetical protein